MIKVLTGGLLFCFLLTTLSVNIMAADQADLQGQWKGRINIAGQELKIVVHFQTEGELKATIDIPQQGASFLPLTNLTFNNSEISFQLPAAKVAAFTGKLEGKTIKGDFTQAGFDGSFYLEKMETSSGGNSPSKDNNIDGEKYNLNTDSGIIYGRLKLPEGKELTPVVLIIPGSGPTDRDGNSALAGKNNSLKMIADVLAKSGIASLRYDKRGIAASRAAVKEPGELRFEDFINDAADWVRKLKADDRFNKVIVLGHSQGSLVGMIAARKGGADAFISVSGVGRPIAGVLVDQLSSLPDNLFIESRQIIEELKKGNTVDGVSKELMSVFNPDTQPFLISWFKYDPAVEIKKLDIPILLIQGTTDLQVAVKDAQLLKDAVPAARLEIIKGMNHILKKAPADRQENLMTYSNPELPLAAGFADILVDFINGQEGIDLK